MKYIKTISVNELNSILQKHFKAKDVFIETVSTASIRNQFMPILNEIGIGGICNITFSTSRKLKNTYPLYEKTKKS